MTRKISIIIPLYNAEKYIGNCIESILNQTFKDFEIILVDDASNDDSVNIVKSYQKKDDRIIIIEKANNEGTMKARETGYTNATGEFLFFCDSDDFLPSNALEILYNNTDKESDIIIGDVLMEYEKGGTRIINRSNIATTPQQYKIAILTGTTCALWGILFKASVFKDHHYITFFHQNFYEDRILLLQILDNIHTIKPVPAISYVYFKNHQSVTMQRYTPDVLESQFLAMKKCYDWNKDNQYLDYYNNRWLLRTLSSYVVDGYNIYPILEKTHLSHLYTLNKIYHYCGAIFAINIYISMKWDTYSKFLFKLRSFKNKLHLR